MFRVLWHAAAARIPAHSTAELALLEPFTRATVQAGRALPAEMLLGALADATAFERRAIRTFAPYDAVLTPALGLPPMPLGWFTEDPDPEQVFARQVQAAPYSSFVNVAGLPAIVLPVGAAARGAAGSGDGAGGSGSEGGAGWQAGIQLVGRPGGEAVLFSIARQLERRFGSDRRHPPAFW